jgi:hypothetical protein
LDREVQEGQGESGRDKPPVNIAIPIYGYQNHVSINACFGVRRKRQATDAALYEGR